jgi:uncharacterized membrane protein HdeD (DUF308 family)
MNPNSFFNKWWLMLVQGILLIFLSYFLFSQSDKLISTSGKIAGFIALLTGSVSIIGFFLAGKNEKNTVDLFSGLFSCIAGLFFLTGTPLAYDLITWFFAAYMIFNVVMLVVTSWHLKSVINWWWYSLILFLFTLVILYFFITGTTVLNISIAVFAGVQFFINGILIIVLAFVVRKLQLEYNQTINQIREQRDA